MEKEEGRKGKGENWIRREEKAEEEAQKEREKKGKEKGERGCWLICLVRKEWRITLVAAAVQIM